MIRLFTRQLRADVWPALLLVLTVALTSMIATLAPRLSSDLDDRQLSQRIGSLSAIQGDVSGMFVPLYRPISAPADPWPGVREAADNIRTDAPEPLRSLLYPAQFVGVQPVSPSWTPPTETGYYKVTFAQLVDPDLAGHADLVDGAWPTMVTDPAEPLQVAVLEDFARKAHLDVGSPLVGGLQVSGIYRVRDPGDRRWEHNPYGARTAERSDPNRGLELLGGVVYAPEMAAGDPTMRLQTTFRITVWFGLDADAVTARGVDVALVGRQLTGMQAKRYPVSTDDLIGPTQDYSLHSELNSALAEVVRQQQSTRTLIAVSAVGPIGVGLALMVLASRLVLERRRRSLDLLRARGLSGRQLRRALLAEGAALGVPGALLGLGVAIAVVPGPVAWWALAPALITGLFPAVTLAWSGRDTPDGRQAGGSTRWRIVGEVLIGLGALAATWRRLASGGDDTGVDLLGAAAPVLLALLVCLVALRIYPLPLRLLTRLLARGRRLTGFLGAARALREPAGGVVPVVTIVLGTTMAVVGASLLGTITVGTERAAWAETGSTVHVSGPALSGDLLARIGELDGVTAVAPVAEAADNLVLTLGSTTLRVRVWLAGPELAEAYAVSRDGSPLPTAMFAGPSPDAPIVLGGRGTPATGSGSLDGLGAVTVVGHLEQLPGVTDAAAWALVARDDWPGNASPPTLALIATGGGTDPTQVADEIAGIVPQARITLVSTELDALRASPTTSGLSRIFVGLSLATAVLMVLAVTTAQAMRNRQLRADSAVLRTLGMRPGQLRALTAWELGPVVLVALVTGLVAGIALAALMVHTTDLRALTGGSFTPALYLDPVGIAAVALGLLAATALVVAISSWLAGRVEVAEQLRRGVPQ